MKKLLKNLVSSQKLCTFAPAFDKQRSVLSKKCSGFSAVGSAHVWGARGRWFESSNPDQKKIQTADYQQFGFFFNALNWRVFGVIMAQSEKSVARKDWVSLLTSAMRHPARTCDN